MQIFKIYQGSILSLSGTYLLRF